jgi:hypothetical protein
MNVIPAITIRQIMVPPMIDFPPNGGVSEERHLTPRVESIQLRFFEVESGSPQARPKGFIQVIFVGKGQTLLFLVFLNVLLLVKADFL